MINRKSISAVILSGGDSKRMNYPKALLKFDDNINFLQKIVNEYSNFGCGKIITVLNSSLESMTVSVENSEIILNYHPDFGRFYSIKSGLNEIRNSEYCFIQNIDNPFINHNILDLLSENIYDADCIIPFFEGRGGHPILIGKKIINDILSKEENNLNLKDFLKKYNCIRIETHDEKILININTPEDYKLYFSYDLL